MSKGEIRIQNRSIFKDDESFQVRRAVLVRFMNLGTSRVWLDDQIVIDPGQAFVEADQSGIGLTHRYSVVFQTISSPPDTDPPALNSGNNLKVRIMKRIGDA